jgi:hypothetical protein
MEQDSKGVHALMHQHATVMMPNACVLQTNGDPEQLPVPHEITPKMPAEEVERCHLVSEFAIVFDVKVVERESYL